MSDNHEPLTDEELYELEALPGPTGPSYMPRLLGEIRSSRAEITRLRDLVVVLEGKRDRAVTRLPKRAAVSKVPRQIKAPRPLRLLDGRLEGPELLTLEELAAFFNVRRETLWTWRRRNGFPTGVRVGGRLRVQREGVEAWIRQRAAHRGASAAATVKARQRSAARKKVNGRK